MEDYLPDSEPLVKAYQIAVNIKEKGASMYVWTNDIITITTEDPQWAENAKNAALLIIYTIFRPRQSNKPLKHDDPISLRKFIGEGQIVERKTFLSWDIHTHTLRVLLPP